MSIIPRKFPIKYHIIGHFSVALAVILMLSGAAIYSFVYEKMRWNMMEKLAISTTSIKDVVENAAGMAIRNHLQAIAQVNIALLQGLEREVVAGRLSRSEAMHRGEELLLQQPVGDHGYIYALSSKGIMEVHPKANLKKADLSELWFVRQQMFYKSGYLEYDWHDPGDDQVRQKSLYMIFFEPWDWIVSVSSYRRDFNFLANDLRLGLKSHQFGETGYAFIVNTQGEIILHPWLKGNVHTFENAGISEVFHRMVTMKKGEFSYDWEDPESEQQQRKIVFFDYIPSLDWYVASTVYEDEIFEPLTRLGWIIGLIVICTLVFTVSLSLYLGSKITNPLARLAEQMRLATQGNISVCAEEQALGEIGLLGTHFNAYSEWLRRSNQKILSEINDRIQAEQQLVIYRQAVEHALEGIVITDPDANILAINHAFSEITGYQPEDVQGQNCRILQSGKHEQIYFQHMWESLLQTGRWSGEIWNRRKSGMVYPQFTSISAIRDQAGNLTNYVGLFHDITEMKHQEEQIFHQAFHDALTGLPNRRLAYDRIEVSIAHAKRSDNTLAVLFIDLDNFKNVNDTLGHEWGDKLLVQVANRLVAKVRDEDTVARLGGDEFLVLVAAVTSATAIIDLVNRLLHSFSLPFTINGNDLFITASIGIAFYPDDGTNPGMLTKHADIAMYQAKARGKNNYCFFTSDLSERIALRQQLENNFRQAIIDREFTVLFQPKINVADNTVTGAEALVRWQKKDGTIVNPDDFIPLAEETGLIIPLGEQIFEQCCLVFQRLQTLGRSDLSIAINLSPLQFTQSNLVEWILSMLRRFGIPGSCLELEITETAMMNNVNKTVENLNQLAKAGIAIAIDDFGTGYSSLSYLKRFPIRILKIDRSFIRDLPHDMNDSQLVGTIILMAHNLGISVVAEGVETEEQLDWLRRCGCEQVQGYYYSRPLTVEDFMQYIDPSLTPVGTLPCPWLADARSA